MPYCSLNLHFLSLLLVPYRDFVIRCNPLMASRQLNQTTADWDTLALTVHRDAQLGALRWQVPPCLGFRFHKCDCTNLVCFDLELKEYGGTRIIPPQKFVELLDKSKL